MVEATENKGFGILFGRGLLGGALGGLVIIATLVNPVTIGNSWYFWLLISYSFFGLPFGLFTGGITGGSIWFIHLKTTARLGPFMRAAIGGLIGLVFWGFVFWWRERSEHSGPSWRSYFTAVFLFGMTTGVLTGLIVGSPTRMNNHRSAQATRGSY